MTLAAAVSGIPAKIEAPLATNIPVGPSGNAHPNETSSIKLTSNSLFLSNKPLITWPAISSDLIPIIGLPLVPIGDLTPSIITALLLIFPP